ncbi:MAG: DUF932 domain-containing protein [Syntrophales bacterium LBB04]|nr:DUF932 domain-containing protein [Syntrophales bacterium LBB04]
MIALSSSDKRAMTTFDSVCERIEALSANCYDELILAKDISFNHLESVNIGREAHYLRPTAQMGMAFRLGIPLHYLRRCPHELQAYNMNYWIKNERNSTLFFRFDASDVRAIFTPRYKPIDNLEIMGKLKELGYDASTQVQCHLDDEFMLVNIPDGTRAFDIRGDAMVPGLSISNSEVGLASVTIAAYILRLICTNGMITTSKLSVSRFRHVSRKILDEFPEMIMKNAEGIEDQRDLLRFSIESLVDDPLVSIERFNRRFALGKEEVRAVEWAWPLEVGPAMFNIVQTYTRAAQFQDLTAEESYRLQRVGGMILGMVCKN